MPDHTGRRRRQSRLPIARLLVLFATLAAVVRLLTLSDPAREQGSDPAPLAVVPAWSGPAPASVSGALSDGASYLPRIYLDPRTSVGVATSVDGRFVRVVLRAAGGRVTELRRVDAADHPEFDGFTASGDTLVWAESVSRTDAPVSTTLWRTNWRTGARPATVPSSTGFANFFGGQYDLVLRGSRIYWAAVGPGNAVVTEIRSVPLRGGQVSIDRLNGEYAMSEWPWAVSVGGGRGTPVELVNLTTDERVKVPTSATELVACSPRWCRMSVLGDNAIVRMDLQRPDGSQRRRLAGSEATPTTVDVAVLDRFVPLATDLGDGATTVGVGLSLYDINSGKTDLVAVAAANIQARDGMLWWSTGTGEDLRWHAIDLRALT